MKGWSGATLRYLPLWGDENAEVNFEWPTRESWAKMDPNISLTSIDFRSAESGYSKMASVRVNYSDGQS